MIYQRTQYGAIFVILLLLGAAIDGVILCNSARSRDVLATSLNTPVLIALLGSALVFSSMTISVSADRVDWNLGFGTFRNVVWLRDITGCKTRRFSPLTGLGIRTNDFKTFLVLINGSGAVDLQLMTGKSLILGSPESDRLCAAIENARLALK